jgi:hypothetical protein
VVGALLELTEHLHRVLTSKPNPDPALFIVIHRHIDRGSSGDSFSQFG